MALARLVLDKSVLNGLRVSIWDAEGGAFQDGTIEGYCQEAACYIIAGAERRTAARLHQFTVEAEEGEQLVLKVTSCARVPLPPGYSPSLDAPAPAAPAPQPPSRDASGGGGGGGGQEGEGGAAAPPPLSAQASTVSEQLSDLVGASFSHTSDGGFEAVVPAGAGPARRASSSAGAAAGAPGEAQSSWRLGGGARGASVQLFGGEATGFLSEEDSFRLMSYELGDVLAPAPPPPQQQQQQQQQQQDEEGEEEPVVQDQGPAQASKQAQQQAPEQAQQPAPRPPALVLEGEDSFRLVSYELDELVGPAAPQPEAEPEAGVAGAAQPGAGGGPAQLPPAGAQAAAKGDGDGSPAAGGGPEGHEGRATPELPEGGADGGGPCDETPPRAAAGAGAAAHSAAAAWLDHARATGDEAGSSSDGGGYWGTPVRSGTPQGGAPAAQGGLGGAAGLLGAALVRRMANFEEISRMISEDRAAPAAADDGAPSGSGADGGGSGGACAARQAAEAGPEAAPQGAGRDLPITAAVADAAALAAALAAAGEWDHAGEHGVSSGAGGAGLACESSSEMVIGAPPGDEMAPDVGPRPPSGRGSWRASRTTIDQELPATDDGMVVDIPQPLSSRRASRASARNLPASGPSPDDPHAQAAPSGPLSARSAGGGGAFGGAGGGGAAGGSRRASRAASSRGFSDQGGPTAPSGAGAGGAPGGAGAWGGEPYVAGAPLHVPGPASRRASRTLSGRLPPDQEPPPAAPPLAPLEDADPDVPPRAAPAPASAPASRRASRAAGGGGGGASGRGTPDSDGCGLSGFEEDLPDPFIGQEPRRRSSPSDPAGPAGAGAAGLGGSRGGAARPAGSRVSFDEAAAPARGSGGAGGGVAGSRRVSRTVSGLLEAAAAAAAAAEAYIGARLSGGGAAAVEASEAERPASRRGTASGAASGGGSRRGSGQLGRAGSLERAGSLDRAGSLGAAAATGAAPAADEGAPAFGGGVLGGLKLGDSFALSSVDSFSCPPVFPFGGGNAGGAGSRTGSASGAATGISLPAPKHSASNLAQASAGLYSDPKAAPATAAAEYAAAEGPEREQPRQVWDEAQGRCAAAPKAGGRGPKANPFADGGEEFGPFISGPFGGFDGTPRAGADAGDTDDDAASARIGTHVSPETPQSGAAPQSGGGEHRSGGGEGGSGGGGAGLRERPSLMFDAACRASAAGFSTEEVGGALPTPEGQRERERAAAQRQAQAEARARAQQQAGSSPGFRGVSIHEIHPADSDSERSDGGGGGRAAQQRRQQQQQQQHQQQQAGRLPGGSSCDERESGAGTPRPGLSEGGPPGVRQGAALDGGRGGGSDSCSPPPGAEAPGLVRRAGSGRLPAAASPGAGGGGGGGGGAGTTLIGMPAYDEDDDAAPLIVAHHIGDTFVHSAETEARSLEDRRARAGRAALHAICGSGAQWYDAAAFGLLGAQIGAAFTPPGAPAQRQLLAAAGLFAAGHALRPAGAALWPAVLARGGRGAVVGWTLALSAFPAALIGALPAYHQAGYVGLGFAAALRLLQGLALGADLAASAAYLSDHAPSRPATHAAAAPAAAALGALAAAAPCAVIAAAAGDAGLTAWGWRAPLVGSLLVSGAAAGLRLAVLRDPDEGLTSAELADRRGEGLGLALRQHWPRVAGVAALGALPAASFSLLAATLPAHLSAFAPIGAGPAMAIQLVNVSAFAGSIFLGGWVSDGLAARRGAGGKCAAAPLLLGCCCVAAAAAYPLWALLARGRAAAAWGGQLLLALPAGVFQGAAAREEVEAMPKAVRSSALGVSYAIAGAIAGGLAPLAAAALASATSNAAAPAFVSIAAAGLSAAACLALRAGWLG